MPNAASKILSGSLAGAAPSRRQGLGGGGGGGGGGAAVLSSLPSSSAAATAVRSRSRSRMRPRPSPRPPAQSRGTGRGNAPSSAARQSQPGGSRRAMALRRLVERRAAPLPVPRPMPMPLPSAPVPEPDPAASPGPLYSERASGGMRIIIPIGPIRDGGLDGGDGDRSDTCGVARLRNMDGALHVDAISSDSPVSEGNPLEPGAILRAIRVVPLVGGAGSGSGQSLPFFGLAGDCGRDSGRGIRSGSGGGSGGLDPAWLDGIVTEESLRGADKGKVVVQVEPSDCKRSPQETDSIELSVDTANALLLAMDAGLLVVEESGPGDAKSRCRDEEQRQTVRNAYLYRPSGIKTAAIIALGPKPNDRRKVASGEARISARVSANNAAKGEGRKDQVKHISRTASSEEGKDASAIDGAMQAEANHPGPDFAPPISLEAMVEAYEACLSRSDPTDPATLATKTIPYYFLEGNVAQRCHDLRSRGLLPSRDRIVFEVRDGIATSGVRGDSEDERGNLVLLVTAQVVLRLGLLTSGGEALLSWYHDSYASADDLAGKKEKQSAKKAKRKKKRIKGPVIGPRDFFIQDVTSLLSCVQFALPPSQPFSDFLDEKIGSPFAATKIGDVVAAIYEYFEIDMPNPGERQEGTVAEETLTSLSESVKPAAGFDAMLDTSLSLHAVENVDKAEGGTADLTGTADGGAAASDTEWKAPSMLVHSMHLTAKRSSNPLLAGGKGHYIGSHFSNTLTNAVDLFREVTVPPSASTTAKRPNSSDHVERPFKKRNTNELSILGALKERVSEAPTRARNGRKQSARNESSLPSPSLSPVPHGYEVTPGKQQRNAAQFVAQAALAARNK